MGIQESKHDLMLRRIQVTIALLAATAGLAVGIFNLRRTYFAEKGIGGIEATVKSADSRQALGGALVQLTGSEQNAVIVSAETDTFGAFVQEDLDIGSYILKVSKAGFDPEVVAVRVDPKRTTRLDVMLKEIPRAAQPAAVSGAPTAAPNAASPMRQAIEEAGASWIKKLAVAKSDANADAPQTAR